MTWAALRRLLPYVRRHQRPILLAFAGSLTATALQLVGPWVLRLAIDDISHGVRAARLAGYAAVLLGIAAGRRLVPVPDAARIIIASRDIEYDMRNDFFAQLQQLPLAYFQAHRTGDLMSRATNDLNAVRMMIGPAVMYSANTVLVFVVAHRADAVDRPAADADGADSAAVRVDRGASTSAARSTAASSRSRRSSPR